MPPFPWIKAARTHNILTSQKSKRFLRLTNIDICFDVSHTALSCAHFGEDIFDHIAIMNKRIKHIHLSDAQGTNSEGLEVGEGSINFKRLHQAINRTGKNDLFLIPEIWQGHLQDGEKFARSLIRYNDFLK